MSLGATRQIPDRRNSGFKLRMRRQLERWSEPYCAQHPEPSSRREFRPKVPGRLGASVTLAPSRVPPSKGRHHCAASVCARARARLTVTVPVCACVQACVCVCVCVPFKRKAAVDRVWTIHGRGRFDAAQCPSHSVSPSLLSTCVQKHWWRCEQRWRFFPPGFPLSDFSA